ncbi:MAG: trypsin-like peptidase domain-containing protein [Acidobacteriota bacterium]
MRAPLLLVVLLVLVSLATPAMATPSQASQPTSFSLPTADLAEVDLQTLPALDSRALDAAERAARRNAPIGAVAPRFAEPVPVDFTPYDSGTWQALDDGSRLWRLRLRSPGAVNLNLALIPFRPPEGARLWVYGPDRAVVHGPFVGHRDHDLPELWTPLVPGEEIVVELVLPASVADADPGVTISRLHHGFRGLRQATQVDTRDGQGSCNNDVACAEADPWRDQTRAVAWFTLNGIGACSGQLINNTLQDGRPYFLTAFHCGVSANNASTTVFYWQVESPTCGALSGGDLSKTTNGATWRADDPATDFALLELPAQPPADFDVYYVGWDISGAVPQGAVGIHHPELQEKAISFDTNPLTTNSGVPGLTDGTHWRVGNWEDGTTEPGSSGSCIYDPTNQLCVGILTGGFASCQDLREDYYGKLAVAWSGGSTTTRLQSWLDPAGLGVTSFSGYDPSDAPTGTTCTPDADTMCLRDGRFLIEVTYSDFDGNVDAAQVANAGTSDSGLFWFFQPDNWELLVKVLDGCGVNGNYWVFAAGTTNVGWLLEITDLDNGTRWTGTNPLGQPAPAITDTNAFATCP